MPPPLACFVFLTANFTCILKFLKKLQTLVSSTSPFGTDRMNGLATELRHSWGIWLLSHSVFALKPSLYLSKQAESPWPVPRTGEVSAPGNGVSLGIRRVSVFSQKLLLTSAGAEDQRR